MTDSPLTDSPMTDPAPTGAWPVAGDREGRRVTAEVAAQRLAASLDAVLGDRLVHVEGTKADYFGEGVVVDAFAVVERCPRRVARPADDFVESVATSRRRVGLFALRHLAEQPRRDGAPSSAGLPEAVAAVVGEQLDWPDGLRGWVGDLDRAGRAALVAAVTTWCDGALRLVGRDPRIRWADPSRVPAWNVPGRLVQLRGSIDAVIGTVARGEKLLNLSDAAPGPADRLRAGHHGLVRALGVRHAPVRVTTASASTGVRVAHTVDAALLELVTDRVVEVVQHRAAPDDAPPWPGNGCSHCHLLDDCAEGTAHLVALRHRRNGSTAPR